MGRDPDAKDCNIDAGDNERCPPFQFPHCALVFCDDCNTIDNDLHQQLDFKHPEK